MQRREVELAAAVLAAPAFIFTYNKTFHNTYFGNHPLNIEIALLMNVLFFWPVIEELLFRGVIQETLSLKLRGSFFSGKVSMPNLVTSVGFMGVHFVHHPPLWAFLVIFPSLVFGYFKERYKTVLVPIVLHAFYNFCFLFIFS